MGQQWQERQAGLSLSRALRVLLVADAEQRREIHAALAQMDEPPLEIREGENGGALDAHGDGTDVVMFVFDQAQQPQAAATTAVTPGSERPVRIALVHDRSTNAIREALRAGADEVVFLPLDHQDVARVLLKISESRIVDEPIARAKLISMVSLTGGAGVTTLAANCALALAHCAARKVALMDLDFQSGDLAVTLNVEPERSILDLNDAAPRLNSVQIESALTRHGSGVYLLAAPRRIEESERIPAAQVGALLDLMGEMVDVVIVDIGRHISDTSVVVWERCDEVLYVLCQSIAAMQGAWRFLDLFGRLNLAGTQPSFVLNRWVARHPISDKHIVNTLARPLIGRIQRDDALLEQTMARGEDLWKVAPRSPLTRSYEVLARQLTGQPHGHDKPSRFLSKIFSRNGVHPRS